MYIISVVSLLVTVFHIFVVQIKGLHLYELREINANSFLLAAASGSKEVVQSLIKDGVVSKN